MTQYSTQWRCCSAVEHVRPLKVGPAWWHLLILQETHYVIFWLWRGLCCDVLQIPNFCTGQQPALLCTLRRLVALGRQQMLSLNGVNAVDKSVKETPPHCRLFVLSGPRSRPCSDTCCGTDRITSYGPVIDAACFLFWREGWQPEPRGAWRIVSVVQGSWHFASSKEGWGMCVCVCVCVHVWNL